MSVAIEGNIKQSVFSKKQNQMAKRSDKAWLEAKAKRKAIFEDTLAYCKKTKKNRVVTEKVDLTSLDIEKYGQGKQNIDVVNQDCVMVARDLLSEGRTCMLNMANAITRGGGVKNGSMAQEEELCRRSNLWYGLRQSYYPLTDNQFIYSKNVKFFKDSRYEMMPEFKCDIITIAAPNLIGFKPGKFPKNYSKTVEHKIRMMLSYPATKGVKNLVLSAFGCGAFRNNPIFMSRMFKKVIKEGLPYDNIHFAILDDQNCKANGISNFNMFKNTFHV